MPIFLPSMTKDFMLLKITHAKRCNVVIHPTYKDLNLLDDELIKLSSVLVNSLLYSFTLSNKHLLHLLTAASCASVFITTIIYLFICSFTCLFIYLFVY